MSRINFSTTNICVNLIFGGEKMGINEYIQIGNRLRKERIEKGYTQKQFAELAGIPYSTYSNYENNNREPGREALEKIAAALGVDPFSLYSFEMASEALEKGINQKENVLLDNYRQLNPSGQQKADNYVEDLTKIPEYQKEPKG